MLESIYSMYYSTMMHRTDGADDQPSSGMPLLCSQLDVGLNIVAGRPSMGATTMAVSLATELSLAGKRVLYLAFPSQRAEEKLYQQCAFHFGLPNNRSEYCKNPKAYDKDSLANMPLWFEKIYHSSDYTYLRIKVLEYVKQYSIQYVFIDCIQEISSDKPLNNVSIVEYVCSELRSLSYDLDVPIIATSKLNRGPEFRRGIDGRTPQLSDLRGGEVEQYARLVYFPFRPEYYNINVESGKSTDKVVHLIIAKNDNGHIGEELLTFDREHLRFYSDQTYTEFLHANLPF